MASKVTRHTYDVHKGIKAKYANAKIKISGAGKMAPVQSLTAAVGDLGSVQAFTCWLTTACNSDSRGSISLFSPPRASTGL